MDSRYARAVERLGGNAAWQETISMGAHLSVRIATNMRPRAEMGKAGLGDEEIDLLAPHRAFPGNRPTTSILYKRLTPHRLGSLITMHEQKDVTQGVVWGIDIFDQWGVELGKQLASGILPEIGTSGASTRHDGSTNGLINCLKQLRHA